MRLDQLPTPGLFKGAQRLLMDVHHSINFMEIAAARSSGRSESIQHLQEFYQAAADYLSELRKPPKKTKE